MMILCIIGKLYFQLTKMRVGLLDARDIPPHLCGGGCSGISRSWGRAMSVGRGTPNKGPSAVVLLGCSGGQEGRKGESGWKAVASVHLRDKECKEARINLQVSFFFCEVWICVCWLFVSSCMARRSPCLPLRWLKPGQAEQRLVSYSRVDPGTHDEETKNLIVILAVFLIVRLSNFLCLIFSL
jgi:hypothetical protein